MPWLSTKDWFIGKDHRDRLQQDGADLPSWHPGREPLRAERTDSAGNQRDQSATSGPHLESLGAGLDVDILMKRCTTYQTHSVRRGSFSPL